MAITPLRTLDRTSATFKDDCDAFFGSEMATFSVEAEAARQEIVTAQSTASSAATTASAAATTATTKAGEASTSATNASNSASAAATSAANAAASAAVASSAAAFVDSNPVVKGSADATKQIRFEVDGLTTGTTRVLTVPDADITLLGESNAATVINKTYKAPKLTHVDKGNAAAGSTVTFNREDGASQTVTIVSGTVTLAVSNLAAAGVFAGMRIKVINPGLAGTLNVMSATWIKPDGTTTTDFSAYLSALGRSAPTSGFWEFRVWSDDGAALIGVLV